MDAAGRRGTPAGSEAEIAEMAGVAGRPAEAVCVNPMACCEPVLAVAVEDVERGGSWERRATVGRPETISDRRLGDRLGRLDEMRLEQRVLVCITEIKLCAHRDAVCREKRTLRRTFEWLWRAEHAANTTIV